MRRTLLVRIVPLVALAAAAGIGWLATQGFASTGGKPAPHHKHLLRPRLQ
jgi:hypothetical protein